MYFGRFSHDHNAHASGSEQNPNHLYAYDFELDRYKLLFREESSSTYHFLLSREVD